MEDFRAEGWTLIADLAAGTRQPFFGWSDFAEAVLSVTEPSAKGALSARRLSKLAYRGEEKNQTGQLNLLKRHPVGLVANKLRGEEDLTLLRQTLTDYKLPWLAALPYDEQLAEAEQRGLAPLEAAPDSPAIKAIYALADKLEDWLGQPNRSNI
jgi:CO dehydrogenase maturation factor